jgi:hypothetical protein
MLRILTITTVFVAAAGPSAAQNTYVSPPGYAAVEGNSSSAIPWVYVGARVQQADGNQVGTPMNVTAIAFRQNDSTSSAAVGQSRDVTVLMSKANLATFSSTFANNYLTPPATVFARRTIVLPDWSLRPPVAPAPFTLRFPFDAPFPYDGADAVMWELVVENGMTGGTFSQDWVSAARNTPGGTTTLLGTGCTTSNGAMSLTTSFSATVNDLVLSFSTLRAPPSAPVVVLIGLSDPNLSIPGLCTALRTDAILSSTLGTASATGGLSGAQITVPWSDSFANGVLFSQVVSPDASQPGIGVALSNGRQSPLPPTRGGPAPVNIQRTYSTSSATATTGIAPSDSPVVTRFEY